MRIRELPADLVREWAAKHARDNAKLEGRELPDDFVMSVQAQQFLNMRKMKGLPEAPLHERLEMEALWG